MNIEKIKNFSQDEQKTLNFFELLRNEIITRDNELNEGIDFIFGRKFANKIDILLNLVITLEDKEELQKENEELKEITRSYNSIKQDMTCFKNKIIIADIDYFDNGVFKEKFIYKDLIEKKIEEYKQRKAKCDDIETEIRLDVKIRAYEELLEGDD